MSAYYGPSEGLHVAWLGSKSAEEHTRRVHNVPPDVGLGWRPYRIIVTSHGGVLPHTAFVRASELRRWLGGRFKVSLGRQWSGMGHGLRVGWIVAREAVRP